MLTTHVYMNTYAHTRTYVMHADYPCTHTCTYTIHADYSYAHTYAHTCTYIIYADYSFASPSSISRPPNVDNPSLLLTNFFLSFMPFSLFYDPLVLTRSVSVTKCGRACLGGDGKLEG